MAMKCDKMLIMLCFTDAFIEGMHVSLIIFLYYIYSKIFKTKLPENQIPLRIRRLS